MGLDMFVHYTGSFEKFALTMCWIVLTVLLIAKKHPLTMLTCAVLIVADDIMHNLSPANLLYAVLQLVVLFIIFVGCLPEDNKLKKCIRYMWFIPLLHSIYIIVWMFPYLMSFSYDMIFLVLGRIILSYLCFFIFRHPNIRAVVAENESVGPVSTKYILFASIVFAIPDIILHDVGGFSLTVKCIVLSAVWYFTGHIAMALSNGEFTSAKSRAIGFACIIGAYVAFNFIGGLITSTPPSNEPGVSHECYVCGEEGNIKYESFYYCPTHYAYVKTVVENS